MMSAANRRSGSGSGTRTPGGGPVVLPRGTTGQRTWRRERLKRQRRQRRLAAVGIFVAVVLAALLLGLEQPVNNKVPHQKALPNPVATVGPLPNLFVVTDDQNTVYSIYLFSPAPSGKGGSVLVIPPDTLTQVVPGGPQAISVAIQSTPNAPGDEKMTATVENLLGVKVGSITVATFSQFEALLEPAGALQINLPQALAPPNGSSGESFAPGNIEVLPSQIGDFIIDQSTGGNTEQLNRFALIAGAWIDKIRRDASAAPVAPAAPKSQGPSTTTSAQATTTTVNPKSQGASTTTSAQATTTTVNPKSQGASTTTAPQATTTTVVQQMTGVPSLSTALVDLSLGVPAIQVMPVTEIPSASSDSPVQYEIDQQRFDLLLPALFPGQPAALEKRPRIQLLNGTGGLGLNEEAQVQLEPYVEVALSGNACTPQASGSPQCFGYSKTEIITYDAMGRSQAAQVARLLGTGSILRSAAQSDNVDMTVIIGADFHVNGQ